MRKKEKTIYIMSFILSNILKSDKMLKLYTNTINSYISVSTTVEQLIQYGRTLCKELPTHDSMNEEFGNYKPKDKGNLGKIFEYALFGQKPNNKSECDFKECERDLKVTKFKKLRDGTYNAKERLTITNVGNTQKDDFGKDILSATCFKETPYYKKSRRGVLIVADAGDIKVKYNTFDDVMKQKVMGVITYDIEDIPDEYYKQIEEDFQNIKNRIKEKNISQSGQKFLHIHPHGSKGSSTRALGFTNKFVTLLFHHYMSDKCELIQKGRSVSIKFH